MAHDIALIAAYLAGELAGDERDTVERHLLTCGMCWADIEVARHGRQLVQLAYEPAPASLRTRVRGTIGTNASNEHSQPAPADVGVAVPERLWRHRWRALAVGVAAAIVLVGAALAINATMLTQADPVAAAVAGYIHQRLPGTEAPAARGPDLGALGLLPSGASAGQLAGQHVDAYAYRDATGRRVFLYLSDQPFPMPREADQLTDEAGAWTIRHHQIVVLCARTPHEVLIIGTDSDLVLRVAATLNLT